MQKLVYFAHGWHLALKDRPLLDEQVEAWPYGPVVRSLYRAFRDYGDGEITGKALALKAVDPGDVPEEAAFTRALLDRVWDVYGPYTAIQLSNMTHEPGSPWHQVYSRYTAHGGRIPKGTDIPPDTIRDFFRARLRPRAAGA